MQQILMAIITYRTARPQTEKRLATILGFEPSHTRTQSLTIAPSGQWHIYGFHVLTRTYSSIMKLKLKILECVNFSFYALSAGFRIMSVACSGGWLHTIFWLTIVPSTRLAGYIWLHT